MTDLPQVARNVAHRPIASPRARVFDMVQPGGGVPQTDVAAARERAPAVSFVQEPSFDRAAISSVDRVLDGQQLIPGMAADLPSHMVARSPAVRLRNGLSVAARARTDDPAAQVSDTRVDALSTAAAPVGPDGSKAAAVGVAPVEAAATQPPARSRARQGDLRTMPRDPADADEAVASESAPSFAAKTASPAAQSCPEAAPVAHPSDEQSPTSCAMPDDRGPVGRTAPAVVSPLAPAPVGGDAPPADMRVPRADVHAAGGRDSGRVPRPEGEAASLGVTGERSTPAARKEAGAQPEDGGPASTRAAEAIAGAVAPGLTAGADAPADAAASVRPVVRVHLPHIEDLPTRDGVRHVRIELDPPGLGRCDLELTVREGAVHAVVTAERPETVVALRQVEGQVRAALADQDVQVAQFDVRHGGSGMDGETPRQGADAPSASAGPRLVRTPAPELRRPAVNAANAAKPSGRVDLIA